MIFHVARDGQPLGTFTQEEIRDHLEAGRLLVTDLVWMRGMEDWEALAQVFEVEVEIEEMGLADLPPELPPIIPGAMEPVLPESWKASPAIQVAGAGLASSASSSEPETSGWSIASLVLGVASLGGLCFTGVPAVICGHTALSDIRRSHGRVLGRGFARAGLVLGYLMCAVSALGGVAYVAWRTMGQVEARAQESEAIRDARILMMALKVHAADHDGKYPNDLQTLVDEGLITSDKPLNTLMPGWVGRPGWKYFGAGLGPADHFSKIILETRARDIQGRGIQVTNDGEADLVLIEDGPVK